MNIKSELQPVTFILASNLTYAERKRQNKKWGQQNHDPFTWYAILAEEIGEVAKAILEEQFNSGPGHNNNHIAVELIQSAAVIFAFLDCLQRQELINLESLSLDS